MIKTGIQQAPVSPIKEYVVTPFKRIARLALDSFTLATGLFAFSVFGTQSAKAYQAMVRLFCITGGYSNDILSAVMRFFSRPYSLSDSPAGILGKLSPQNLTQIQSQLERDGYFVFDTKLSDQLLQSLLEFGLNTPLSQRAMDNQDPKALQTTALLYPRGNPKAARYDVDMEALVNFKDVQDIIADESLLAVAQNYLKCRPVLDIVALWWHTAFASAPDKTAAQFFHFDMDRVKWLKFFFYITDVGPENGPHSFIAGSQRSGGIPWDLLKGFYTRLDDAEVYAHFPPERRIEFTGLKGTIIAEDTRGLHKGKHVQSGDRLVFQLQYSNSIFGGDYSKVKLKAVPSEILARKLKTWPRLYSALRV